MRRFDFVGGIFLRIGRRWLGLVKEFPFVCTVPVICGGTEAESAQGTFIETGDGASPENFSELAEVSNIGGPNEKADEIDATHLRSPEGYKEFIPSFKDGGEIPLTLNYIAGSTTQSALRAEFNQTPPPTKNRRITWPDGSTTSFAGWVKARGASAQVGSKISSMVTLRGVGAVTLDES